MGARVVGSRNRLAGHTLPHEGRIHTNGVWRRVGQARCSCGATSPILGSDNARKVWHRQHKDEIRSAR